MPRLTLLPLGKKIHCESGSTLLEVIRKAGIEIPAPCNGRGQCGKCKVRITDSSLKPIRGHDHLTTAEIEAGIRLACEQDIAKEMQVTLPASYSLDTRILEGEWIRSRQIDPAAIVKSQNRRAQLAYHGRSLVVLKNWNPSFAAKGLAVDLGTTTVVSTLMDLQTGRELATASAVNPQIRYGHDVLTRIQHASTRQGLRELTGLITQKLNNLIEKTCRKSGTHPHEIVDVVIGGNTTMLQIAAGINPEPLGRIPFTAGIEGGRTYPPQRFGLMINPQARVYIPPVIHAFVGTDISAGLLSVDFFNQNEPALFVDLGTNGEMALTVDNRVWVTSTAAGPAFEGMGITHGMRAAPGAIETVWADDRYLSVRTVGDQPAIGICGSGIIDLMACLIRLEAVESGGRLRTPPDRDLKANPLAGRYEMLDAIASIRLSGNLYFTQKDIRQFQLAKSAIQTGMEVLLDEAQIDLRNLEHILIAGAFGYHLRCESLQLTGVLPNEFKGKVNFVGNTSRTGCVLALMDAGCRDQLEGNISNVNHIAIAERPDFQDRFIKNISFG